MADLLVDLRDTRFLLYDVLDIESLCRSETFSDHSRETFEMVLNAAEKLALNDFAPVNGDGDSVGCKWQDGKVSIPPSFHEPFRRYCDGGWISISENGEVGGQGMPLTIQQACNELFFSANHSLTGYMGITHSAAKAIEVHGSARQKKLYMEPLYSGHFSGGMNLTEPQAGSDVGAIRVKAVRRDDGAYSIQGTKIFITGGEQDVTENIVHIVLARIEGDPEGSKGLSCFIVPKIRIREDGTLGDWNHIACAGIEHKMGMKGSATCTLNYGETGECTGELLGGERDGIRVMFHMMNEQRLLVGLQGLAQGSTAYLHALKFARERFQGAAFGSKSAKQVAIVRHPDVLNNLMIMKTQTEGMRALLLYTVSCIDRMAAGVDETEKRRLGRMVEFLTPICKAYCTEKGFDVCVRAMQVHGGYGYCKEYHIEQFLRDCKIMSIYEGTNGIQANDLFGRKIRMQNGELFKTVLDTIRQTTSEAACSGTLAPHAENLTRLLDTLEKVTQTLCRDESPDDSFLKYSRVSAYLDVFGDILLGWIFLRQALVAAEKLGKSEPASSGTLFYQEKIHTALFYLGTMLPVASGKISAIGNGTRAILGLRELTVLAMGEE